MNTRSLLFSRPPVWFHPASRRHPHLEPAMQSWLFEPGSLTRRLRELCGGRFRVRLLRQDWDRPYADESRALGSTCRHRAVVREVLLQWEEQPLVAARSVIPVMTLRNAHRGLIRLGERPLGEILFADPRLRRQHLELAEIEPAIWCREIPILPPPANRIWGRRSLYTLGPGRLLVAEFFLPALFALTPVSHPSESWGEPVPSLGNHSLIHFPP